MTGIMENAIKLLVVSVKHFSKVKIRMQSQSMYLGAFGAADSR